MPGEQAPKSIGDVTRLLHREDSGALFEAVYTELRAIAGAQMKHERTGHTLNATALVHEAYVRIVKDGATPFSDRAQFYFAAAEAMRRILIEHARKRGAAKRGGGRRRIDFESVEAMAEGADSEEIVAFDESLVRLEKEMPMAAAVVRLRFFAGLNVEQTAEALGISARSVNREWTYARAWLFRAIESGA